jgi:hypothetical protein
LTSCQTRLEAGRRTNQLLEMTSVIGGFNLANVCASNFLAAR